MTATAEELFYFVFDEYFFSKKPGILIIIPP